MQHRQKANLRRTIPILDLLRHVVYGCQKRCHSFVVIIVMIEWVCLQVATDGTQFGAKSTALLLIFSCFCAFDVFAVSGNLFLANRTKYHSWPL